MCSNVVWHKLSKTTISFVLCQEAHCPPPLSLLLPHSALQFLWSPHQDFEFKGFITGFLSTIDPNFGISLGFGFKLWLMLWGWSLAWNWFFLWDRFVRWGWNFIFFLRGPLILWLCIIFWSCLFFWNWLNFWHLPLLSFILWHLPLLSFILWHLSLLSFILWHLPLLSFILWHLPLLSFILWHLPLLSFILSWFSPVIIFYWAFWSPEYSRDFCTWTCPWRFLSLLGSRIG